MTNTIEKHPEFRSQLTNALTRKILEKACTTYSITRKPRKNKYFHGTSFYSAHPHYRWHVDLQDMTLFRKAASQDRKDAYNFMLVCVDDFSNYIMVELIKNKRAATMLNALVKIIKRE